jgi:hypothetical protein
MKFVKIYNSVKCNDEMGLKHSFRFYKKKIKLFLCTPWRHIGGAAVERHSFLTWPLEGDEWSTSHPSHLSQGSTQNPLNMTLGEHHSQSGSFGEGRILLHQPGFEPWTAQPVALLLSRLPQILQGWVNDDLKKCTKNWDLTVSSCRHYKSWHWLKICTEYGISDIVLISDIVVISDIVLISDMVLISDIVLISAMH